MLTHLFEHLMELNCKTDNIKITKNRHTPQQMRSMNYTGNKTILVQLKQKIVTTKP